MQKYSAPCEQLHSKVVSALSCLGQTCGTQSGRAMVAFAASLKQILFFYTSKELLRTDCQEAFRLSIHPLIPLRFRFYKPHLKRLSAKFINSDIFCFCSTNTQQSFNEDDFGESLQMTSRSL